MTNEVDLKDMIEASVREAWTVEGQEPDPVDLQDAKKLVETFFQYLALGMANSTSPTKRAEINKVGTFRLEKRAPRSGVSLQGVEWATPKRFKIVFQPSPAFVKTIADASGLEVY